MPNNPIKPYAFIFTSGGSEDLYCNAVDEPTFRKMEKIMDSGKYDENSVFAVMTEEEIEESFIGMQAPVIEVLPSDMILSGVTRMLFLV